VVSLSPSLKIKEGEPLTGKAGRSSKMKRNLLVLAVMVAAVLFLTPYNAVAQCPQDPNDLGICDTLYVETFDCDHEYNAEPGSFDSVRVAIYVTHDSNTFWYEPFSMWVQDSIAAFVVPLTFWHQPPGCADSVILPNWDNWNNTVINPNDPRISRSIFRHIVDEHTGDTVYNRLLEMVEAEYQPWIRVLDIEPHSSDGDSGHAWLALIRDYASQNWWEGERELLATLTFHVYMSEDCDTTEIGIDSTFWPPTNPLEFARYDAVTYTPRHFLPVRDTIYYVVGEPAEPFLRVGDWLNPEPWHNWIGGPDDTTQIQLQIVDPDSQIQYVDFYYSTDGGSNWIFLQTDYNGYEPFENTTTPVDPQGDGWSAYLPHSILPLEIVPLHLKAIAYMEPDTLVVTNQTTYDPSPPSSITLNVYDWQAVTSETLYLDIDPVLADIESIVCYLEEKVDTFSKGIPKISQQPHSCTHCAPTAAAACLKYFEAQGDTHIAGGLNDHQLVDAIAGRSGTNQGHSGTYPSDLANGLRSWISDHCNGYTVRGPLDFDWKEARDELERCQDVLMGIYWDEGGGHRMTLNSIVNTPLPNGKIKVDFMDPWTGDYEWGEMNPNTGHVSGFTGAGASGTLENTIIVCPKEPDPGGGGPGPPQGGGGGPNPPPIPIPFPHPGDWWIHAVVIDQSGNAHRVIRVVRHIGGVPCDLIQDQDAPTYYFSGFAAEDAVAKYFDPEVYCEEPVYPYKIHDVEFYLYDFAGVGSVDIRIDVHTVDIDSCDGPGTQIYLSDPITVTTFYPDMVHLDLLKQVCVNGPFFISIEYASGVTGTTPSFLFDDDVYPCDTCHAWVWYESQGYSPPWWEWSDFWAPPAPGCPILRVTGFTQHPDCPRYICGDCNGDGVVDISDVVYLINYLFIPGSPPPVPLCIGDVNCDGVVDVSDVVYLINYLFIQGSPPPCPDCCSLKAKMEEFPGQKIEKVLPQKKFVPRRLPRSSGDLKRIE
jgi:hypothetical protein